MPRFPRLATYLSLLLLTSPASADEFPKADLRNGRALYASNRCAACHEEKTRMSNEAFYSRSDLKVRTIFDLKRQVSLCSTQLNLPLFPDDERDIAAYLNAAFYKLAK